MVNHKIWLDHVSNDEVGIRLQGALEIAAPEPNMTAVTVPGRNGDLHYYDGSYKNRSASVGAYVYRPEDVKDAFGEIHEWLFGAFGYRRIETDDDSEHFMLGRIQNGADVAARLNRLAPFRLQFDCKPQRFLIYGEDAVSIDGNTFFYNPTIYTAQPIYKIFGAGDGKLTVGAYEMEIVGMEEYLIFDAETENAYKGTANQNYKIYCPRGMPFEGGGQPINFSGGITKIEITPRWWEL